jgi:predicted ATPase/class 3 adenylate cyclase
MPPVPSETLTFLYTDIQGSTRLWQQHRDVMGGVVARHDRILREIVEAHGGAVFRTMGDAVCAAFHTAPSALRAAVEIQQAILGQRWGEGIALRIRIAIHTGAAETRDGDYTGHTLNRVARLLSAGHGGQILLSDITRGLALDELPRDLTLVDLGEHRLKDLERPERIYQAEVPGLPSSFPPLRTLDTMPNNLPSETTSFVGREAEVEAVVAQLGEPGTRLLTLVGPGGTGKTRLALRVSAKLLDQYRDGVFFVPLAAIQDPNLVASAVATTLGIRDSQDGPIDARLTEYLRDKQMLLVLDNFEQVLAAAALLSGLLATSAELTILVTSRSVLHLTAEHEYAVPPLATPNPAHFPDTQTLAQYDAVALFTQRVQAMKSDFTLTDLNAPAVAAICHRLDGLPLAIELAAARIRLFSPEALLKRLTDSLGVLTGGPRDLPARQQTLRDTIDWSYSLLARDQQRLFIRLAVFAGGWTLEAAQEICNPEGDLDVLDAMEALVEQSLVRPERDVEPRFTMLATIREFASERLRTCADAEELRRRHAEWCARLTHDAPDLGTGIAGLSRLLPVIGTEQDNLRAALNWSLDRGEWVLFARLVRSLSLFWFGQGEWTEAVAWTDAALAVMPPASTPEYAAVLFSSGFFHHRRARDEPATQRLKAAAQIWRTLEGRKKELSATLYFLGERLAWRGHRDAARRMFEEALAESQESDGGNAPMALTSLGILAREAGDYDLARSYVEEGLKTARSQGNVAYSSIALNSLADLARVEGDYERAGALYQEALRLSESAGVVAPRAGLLHNLAYVAHHQGNDAQARLQLMEALNVYRDRGERRGMAECVAGIAVLEAAADPGRAARLLAAALTAAESMGSRLSSSNQREYDEALASIRTRLDQASLEEARQAGQAMTLDDAVALATQGGIDALAPTT